MKRPLLAAAALAALPAAASAQATIRVPSDVPTIQGAIELAHAGDTVLVAPGAYVEEIDFLGKAMTVRSEAGADVTTLSNSSTPVSFVSGEGPGSVLRGFTVTDNHSSRAAIFGPGTSPTIERCVIRGNRSAGGITAGVHCDGTLTDCLIEDNGNPDGTGGVFGAPTLRRCVLRNNWGYDAAAALLWGGRMEDCLVLANSSAEGSAGGAVSIASAVPVTLERCVIAQNTKDTWGGQYSAHGAGVTVQSGSVPAMLVRCTIVDNLVPVPGSYGPDTGGIHGPATLVACIVRGNDGMQVDNGVSGTYCDVGGSLAGTGNIDADPLFRDAPGGDYRLFPGSPCIDAGDPAAPLDPDGSRADMGALAFIHATAVRYNGSGANPVLFGSPTPPAIGTTWNLRILAAAVPGTTVSGVVFHPAGLAAGSPTPFGQRLVAGPRLFADVRASSGLQDDFLYALPASADLLGLELFAQAFVRAPGSVTLGNALRILVGE